LIQRKKVDIAASYLVGDAAGRPADHTDDDRHFSMNVGLKLFTPEEYFLGAAPEAWHHKFDPSWYLDGDRLGECLYKPMRVCANEAYHSAGPIAIPKDGPTLLLLVGLPGSGKTAYYFNVLHKLGCERVEPSPMSSTRSSVDVATDMLKARKCVVIGTTVHPLDVESGN
jgi:bifunctional polynucleotide phosphatase/kinase